MDEAQAKREFKDRVINWLKASPRSHEDIAERMYLLTQEIYRGAMDMHHFKEREIMLKGIFAPMKTGYEK